MTPTRTSQAAQGHVPRTIGAATIHARAGIAWKRNPGTFAYCLSHKRLPPITGSRAWEHYAHSTLLSTKFAQAATTPGARQIWCIPPRYGKSLTGSIWGPAWYLDLWPHKRVIIGSYAAELANLFGRDVRNLIAAYPDMLRVTLRPDSRAAHRWNTPQGGGMLTAGFDGTVTGFGADLLIIDDPFKGWAEAQSETIRNTVWNTWLSVFKTRLQPGASVIVIMTRWHESDLVGRLLQADADGHGEGWEVIRLPAIAEDDTDVLGRTVGEALCPELYPIEDVERIKATTSSYIWAGMYQQRPAPDEGGVFKRGWWNYYTKLPATAQFDLWIASWDMSFKNKEGSDYVVGQLWARRGAEKWLIDEVRGLMDFPETKKAVRAFRHKWPRARLFLIEDKANGPAVIADLRRELSGLVAVTPKDDKLARARVSAADAEAGNVFLPDSSIAPWIGDWVEEFAAFNNGAHDDRVDAFSQAMDRLNAIPTRTEEAAYTDTRHDDRR